jgi:hypothetical protein
MSTKTPDTLSTTDRDGLLVGRLSLIDGVGGLPELGLGWGLVMNPLLGMVEFGSRRDGKTQAGTY